MKIDLSLLQQQKETLLNIISRLEGETDVCEDLTGLIHLIDAAQDEQEDKFPNGLSNWIETHHEIVKEVERMLNQSQDTWIKRLYDVQANGGTGGIWNRDRRRVV